ncbi:TRAP-type C4-dicarboxylate transport system, small permease component (plasmid) [Hartmannibacter diazotrophicus]|uniref:TRAP transporter small permease protein n=1 Tax=Hartmannibacter diazotrophicus TaxID=1482074 RepID=A0A2C9DDW5_9HYPH|nr:TRAP transporter small permease [Hartmannibacter diazotrophicus]SON58456.1 TRAP-type C4-dicarboxylate transport system, small permease component [Hartmannibacter diazotrophicus]
MTKPLTATEKSQIEMPVLRVLDLVNGLIGLVCKTVVVLAGLVMLGSIGLNVVARYIISVGGLNWAEEVPKLAFAWFIMAGVVLALQGGNHIAVDLIFRVLSTRRRQVLVVVINLLITAAYIVLCSVALQVADIAAAERNPLLGTPGSLGYYALAVGAALTAVGAVSIAIRVALLGPDAAPEGRPEDSVQ